VLVNTSAITKSCGIVSELLKKNAPDLLSESRSCNKVDLDQSPERKGCDGDSVRKQPLFIYLRVKSLQRPLGTRIYWNKNSLHTGIHLNKA